MSDKPNVFVSATSGDLRSIRQIVKEALLTINCHPVEQTNFEPDWRTVEGMLRAKIEGCQALIHIVGMRYGAEPDPATLPPGTPRRSYTQMEYEIGCRLHEEHGDEGFRVYTFICPPDFPYDTGAEPEPEEKAALQRAHRTRLMDSPFLYERPETQDSLEARVLALQEQVLSIRRDQADTKREVITNRRIGIRAFAVLLLALSLIGGGLWWVNHRQDAIHDALKMDAPALRARLAEASERTLQEDLAAAAKETSPAEEQRLSEAAEADHQSRLGRIDDLANRLTELSGDTESSPVLRKMTRFLESEGVDAALAYIEGQREAVLAEVRAARDAERQRIRTKLEPLLQAAGIQRSKGLNDEARAAYRELIELEPEWPEALSAYAYFLYDRSTHAQSYGTLETALADAEESHRLAQRLTGLDADDLDAQRLLSVSLTKLGDLAVAQGDGAGAARRFTESLAIRERLAASDPANAAWQRDLSVSLNKLGDLAVAQGDGAGAARRYTESLAIFERLAASDPANAEWQRDLSLSCYLIASKIHMPQEQWKEALPLMERSLAIDEKLAASDPSNVMWQQDARVSRRLVAEIREKLGE